jgi:hypothetical protein
MEKKLRWPGTGRLPAGLLRAASSVAGRGPALTPAERFFWLKLALSAGLLGGFALSRRLWLAAGSSARSYPLTPVLDFLPPVPFPLDYVWLAALVLLLLAIAVAPRPRRLIVAFVVLAGLLSLWDLSRWQPWFYQYLFMLALVGAYTWRDDETEGRAASLINSCRLIVAATYFWGGLQKMNYSFASETVPSLTNVYLRHLPESFRVLQPSLAFIIPLVETATGLGLLTRRFREASVLVALATHLFILALLVPVGRNTVIWPWNVAMAALVVVLFRGERSFSFREILWQGRTRAHALILILFGVMPLLNFFNLWDAYLSANLYSGNTRVGVVRLSETVKSRLPPKVQGVMQNISGTHVLKVDRWSYRELNVPAYPEWRLLRNVARQLCAEAQNPAEVVLEVHERPALLDGRRRVVTYGCDDF